ncbi:MAG TPA: hypothetical protein VF108_13150 [Actinomycetota bacterium]
MAIKDAALLVVGAFLGAVIVLTLIQPSPGESFPAVFRGTTQAVTASGDGVAFYPNERYSEMFDAFPAFEVAGDNRTSAVRGEVCLAPGTGEQDVVFAVADYQLVWYACLTEAIVRE